MYSFQLLMMFAMISFSIALMFIVILILDILEVI